MDRPRRRFMAQSLIFLSSPAVIKTMPHIVLLGDSIFDNASYTGGKPDVLSQLRNIVPPDWKATLLAVDGATTSGIPPQLAQLPPDATHLVLSVGGNDALGQSDLLDWPVRSTAQAFTMLADATRAFENAYRKAVALCLERNLPLTICTIYNGNFPDADFQKRATAAVAVYNDAIIRVGAENRLTVIELRRVCDKPEDYANPIEPSSTGGAKIARAILRVIGHSGDTGYYARVTA